MVIYALSKIFIKFTSVAFSPAFKINVSWHFQTFTKLLNNTDYLSSHNHVQYSYDAIRLILTYRSFLIYKQTILL